MFLQNEISIPIYVRLRIYAFGENVRMKYTLLRPTYGLEQNKLYLCIRGISKDRHTKSQ